MAEEERDQEKLTSQKRGEPQKAIQVPKSPLTEAAESFVGSLAEAVRAEVTKKDEPTAEKGKNIVTVDEGFTARDTFSSKASEITRQLGFAGIAVIWIFKVGDGSSYSVPGELVPPALMLVVGITFDLLHYVAGAILWQLYTKAAQTEGRKEFDAPAWINYITWALFAMKIIAVISAYFYLISYLIGKIR